MLVFRSEEHVDRWCQRSQLARGAVLEPEQCRRLAFAWFSGDRRDPAWRRHPPDEAKRLFDGIGLTGDFWKLT